jgi:hypothetical protein
MAWPVWLEAGGSRLHPQISLCALLLSRSPDDGLQSFDGGVSYLEASEVLDALARLANEYQDPHSLREKWESEDDVDAISLVARAQRER